MIHAQGRSAYFAVKYTNGQAHCQFTDAQTMHAFEAMRAFAKTGKKPAMEYLP
jgi:hypothetical protein